MDFDQLLRDYSHQKIKTVNCTSIFFEKIVILGDDNSSLSNLFILCLTEIFEII